MKVTIEYEALLKLLMVCGEAKAELEQAGRWECNYRRVQPSATDMAKRLGEGVAAIVTTPAAVTQDDFHGGPG